MSGRSQIDEARRIGEAAAGAEIGRGQRIEGITPRSLIDGLLLAIGAVDGDVAPPFGKVRARSQAERGLLSVAPRRQAILGIGLYPLEILAHDEVDDARNGEIGRASCRERVCQYV